MNDNQKWKCSNCGYAVQQKIPPNVCPSCNQSCGFVDASNYVPDSCEKK